MKIYYQWILLLFFVYPISGSVSYSSVTDDVKIREKRNIICSFGLTDLVTDALYSSLEDIRQQDPLSLDDAWEGRLHNGVFRGLSTLTNTTDLNVYCNEDDIMIFTTSLRMENALIWYQWTRRVVFKFKGTVWMKATEVDFDLEVRLNTTSGLNFEVTNTLITKVDDFKIGFRGLGYLDPLVRTVLKKLWKGKVDLKIGSILKKTLEKKLSRVARSFDWFTFW